MCVCPGHCFAEEGDPGINNTRLCCCGPSFYRGGGGKQKNRASLNRAFAYKGGGGICAGGRTSKTNTRRIDPGHCFGAGGGENKKPLSIGQSTGGDGRRRLEYLNQHVKQRLVLSAQSGLDDCGSKMLAAAISLQKSKGRSRLGALRAMCTSLGVQRREKASGKLKDRTVGTLQELLTNAVCLAAAQYSAASPTNAGPEQRGAAEHE